MEKLSSFILEKLNNNSSDKLLKQLASKSNLSDYVNYLNKMLQNNDARNVLKSAFLDGNDPAIKFSCETININVTKLHPTQSEIDVDKSIGYPFTNIDAAKRCMKMFFQDSVVKMPFPLITFNGNYIIDGHHRWSQVYSFNPDAKIECFNIKADDKITPNQMLKITQGMLAAKRAEDDKGNIPQNFVEGANVFKMSDEEIKDTILQYCRAEGKDDIVDVICSASKTTDAEDLANYLCDNLLDLQQENNKYSRKGNPRGVMPQTDRGGDDPDNSKTAEPNYKGSVLNKFKSAKTTKSVVKK